VAALSAPTRNVRSIRREARAKINAFLRVHGEREDGYHDIESLVLPITLAGDVPVGGLNLALVAALALADECPDASGALIEIDKRIPVAAGLGGGSADAAATIDALNELWGCGADAASIDGLCERLGSDVPAMRAGTPVVISGRGERLEAAEVAPLHWVLVRFGFGVRSPDAYRWWDEDGGRTGPDPGPVLAAAAVGDAEVLGPLLFNDLEPSVVARHPAVGRTKRRLLDDGAVGALMSGSGSSVVGLARDAAHAEALAARIDGATALMGPPPT
jgi:4-diphosphocytidyl-2-C-methyl-D-erythritol kinase